jgi:pimeloyl-ACP methyl ester carboxylesterase
MLLLIFFLNFSIGAITLFLFASIFPEHVSKMISLDLVKPVSVSVSKLPVIMRGIITEILGFSEVGSPSTVTYQEARQSLVDNYKGSVDDKAADVLLIRGLKRKANAEDAYEFVISDMRILVRTLTLSEEQIKVLIANIRCPLLIIRASNGLKNFTEKVLGEYLDIYRSSSQDFRIVDVEGTHHVHLTHPERVAPHILQFLLPPPLASKL